MNSRRTTLSDSPLPPSALVHASRPADREPIAPPELGPLALRAPPLPPKLKPRAVILSMPGRCLEKGCVFPVVPGSGGRCIHHQRQQQEPGLYSSQQPSSILVARGKFGPPRLEEMERCERSENLKDRRRMMAERERFLGE